MADKRGPWCAWEKHTLKKLWDKMEDVIKMQIDRCKIAEEEQITAIETQTDPRCDGVQRNIVLIF